MIAAIAAVALIAPVPATAMTYFLVAQWNEGPNHFCKYSNGTVLNVGFQVCPTSIEG